MNKFSLLLAVTACSALPLGTMRAQAPSPSPAATPASTPTDSSATDKPHGKGKTGHGAIFRDLAPEDRQKLMAARKAALADPAVQSAKAGGDKRAAAKAMREAMLRSDPSVGPLLDKVRAEKRQERTRGPSPAPGTVTTAKGGGVKRGGAVSQQLAFLPADERARLIGASRTAQGDPKVVALRQAWTAAATPEAKVQAGKAYRTGLRDVMLRNDPSLAPIVQKVQDHRQMEAEDMAF